MSPLGCFNTSSRPRVLAVVLSLILLIISCESIYSQKQLIFIYKGAIVARYTEGNNIRLKLKNGKEKAGFIVELRDFSMITSNDTIQFTSIGKIRGLKTKSASRWFGRLFMLGGFGYVAIDQLNAALGYNKSGFGTSDWTGLAVGGVGAALTYIHPSFQRLRPGTLIRTIDYHSPYYEF